MSSQNTSSNRRHVSSMSLSGKPSHHHSPSSASNGVSSEKSSSRAGELRKKDSPTPVVTRESRKQHQQQQQQESTVAQNGSEREQQKEKQNGSGRPTRERAERLANESRATRSSTPQSAVAEERPKETRSRRDAVANDTPAAADKPSPRKQQVKVKLTKLNRDVTPNSGAEAPKLETKVESAAVTEKPAAASAVKVDELSDDDEFLLEALRVEEEVEQVAEQKNSPAKPSVAAAAAESESNAVVESQPIASSTPGNALDKPKARTYSVRPVSSYSQIGGRRGIRPLGQDSYRRLNTELDQSELTNTSMNVTVGSEAPNESSFFSFIRRKRIAEEPLPTLETTVEVELDNNKRRRLGFGSLIGVVTAPFTALRSCLASADAIAEAETAQSEHNGDEEVNDIQNISGGETSTLEENIIVETEATNKEEQLATPAETEAAAGVEESAKAQNADTTIEEESNKDEETSMEVDECSDDEQETETETPAQRRRGCVLM